MSPFCDVGLLPLLSRGRPFVSVSWVRRDGDHDDLASLSPVVPEDPVGCRRLTFCVGCKDLFATRTLQAFVFVGSETGVVQVGFHEAEGLSDGLEALLKTLVLLKRLQLLACGRRECQRKSRHARPLIDLIVGVLRKRADLSCLTASGFFYASTHALQYGLVLVEPDFVKGNGSFWRE